MKFLCVLVILFISASAFPVNTFAEAAEEPEAAVSKVISAHGGREALEKAHSISASGKIFIAMSGKEGTYQRYLSRPGKLRVVTAYGSFRETRILNGDKGYRGVGDGKPVEVSGYKYLSMAYQYKYLDLTYLLLGKMKLSIKSRDDDMITIDARDDEGPLIHVYVDSKTWLIKKVSGEFSVAGSDTTLSAEFSDYTAFNGLLLPMKITNYGGTFLISRTDIDTYEINPDIDESLFSP